MYNIMLRTVLIKMIHDIIIIVAAGADPEPPIRGVLNRIFAHEFLATPLLTKSHPLNCRKARQLSENGEKSVELDFLSRQVYQSDFIAKCMSDRGFLAKRGGGARASYVYRSLYVVLAGGGGA